MAGAFVQAQYAFSTGNPNTVNLTLPSAVTAGNTLVAFTCNMGGIATNTISDTKNGSWPAAIGTFNDTTNGIYNQVFAIGNVAAGSTTVTLNVSVNFDGTIIVVAEFSGIKATADGYAGNGLSMGNTTDGITSGNLTNAAQPATLIGFVANISATTLAVAGTGFGTADFTSQDGTNNVGVTLEHRALSTTTPVAATFTAGNNNFDLFEVQGIAFDTPGPTINTQPASATIMLGQLVTFTVSATSTGGSLTYQWKKNGSAIGGATSSSYTTPVLLASDNQASWSCDVSDSNGTTPTVNAVVTIVLPKLGMVPLMFRLVR